jgi:pilus assembly protein Flp/PilA
MRSEFWNICLRLRSLLIREDGQDLVEYALVASLISTALVLSMNAVAAQLNTLVTHISAVIATV